MAISSANFQKAKSNSVAETTREFEAKYLLPKEHRGQNEFYNCGVDEKILFNQEVSKAVRKGGRVPKFENSIWEGVINLNKKHTIEDVNRVGEHIAKKFNLHYTRGALHRDEGHINEKGKVEYNYHAHINFMTYKDGKQNWRLEFVNKEALRELQTEVAELLGMDRGELNSKSVRANHRHFREKAEEIKAERIAVKEVLATKEQLKTARNELNKYLQVQGAKRPEYVQLDNLKKELEEKLKEKTLTEKELLEKFQALEKKLVSEINQNKSLQEQKTVLEEKVSSLEEKIVLNANMSDLELNQELQNIVKEEIEIKDIKTGLFSSEKAPVLKDSKSFFQKIQDVAIKGSSRIKEEVQSWKNKYDTLKSKYDDLIKKSGALQKENENLKEKVRELESDSSIKQQNKNITTVKDLVEQMETDVQNKERSSNIELFKKAQMQVKQEKLEEQKREVKRGRDRG